MSLEDELFNAIEASEINTLRALLEEGAVQTSWCRAQDGGTALHVAAEKASCRGRSSPSFHDAFSPGDPVELHCCSGTRSNVLHAACSGRICGSLGRTAQAFAFTQLAPR